MSKPQIHPLAGPACTYCGQKMTLTLCQSPNHSYCISRKEATADAAHELLCALKNVLAHHKYNPRGPDFPEAWAAIRKAEGREP